MKNPDQYTWVESLALNPDPHSSYLHDFRQVILLKIFMSSPAKWDNNRKPCQRLQRGWHELVRRKYSANFLAQVSEEQWIWAVFRCVLCHNLFEAWRQVELRCANLSFSGGKVSGGKVCLQRGFWPTILHPPPEQPQDCWVPLGEPVSGSPGSMGMILGTTWTQEAPEKNS